MKANIIHHGDCLEILRSLPSDSVDFTFADPPFNLNKKYNSTMIGKALTPTLSGAENG